MTSRLSPSVARLKTGAALALVLAGAVLTAAGAHASVVEVAVTGIVEARGHVRVQLCTKDTFLKPSCPYEGSAPATVGATVVKINAVEPGEYAVQAFHDESDQGVVHQNFLGIPRERIGFSNDAPVRLRGPRFKEAAFMVGHELERVTLRVRHLFHAD